jgi:uncharacterized phage protein (TIGR01671 family)
MYSAHEMGQDELQLNPDGRGFFNAHSVSPKLSQYFPHMIPLQFTGLKDKSGKEIYEEDILLIPDTYTDRILDDGSGPTENNAHLAPVKFQDGSFGIDIQETGNDFGTKGFWSFSDIHRDFGMMEFEVIGNIYENPELVSQ